MQAINENQFEQQVLQINKLAKQLEISSGWQSTVEGDVKGYKKKSTGNSIVTKGQITINLSFQKVVEFFMKEGSFQKINENCIQNKLLHEKKGKYKVNYIQMKTPFPLDNRDGVNISTWINQGNKFYLAAKSCNYPIEVPGNFVRSKLNIAIWILQKVDSSKTKVTNISDMDPMGNIPDMVKNSVAGKRIEILKSLQKIIKKQGN